LKRESSEKLIFALLITEIILDDYKDLFFVSTAFSLVFSIPQSLARAVLIKLHWAAFPAYRQAGALRILRCLLIPLT
jgi:hypothetical protein